MAHSNELTNLFGPTDLFDIEAHKQRLIQQYFPNVGKDSSLGETIKSTLMEARNDTERLRLEMIISNGKRKYSIGCLALEEQMKTNIGSILGGNA
ncbi:MAG: hypothetical protein PHZ26_02660 [Candidatus Gracilibacteria bacterium]|nr:hypothetical protein [Candidatus Gracilibacteria bacterium]